MFFNIKNLLVIFVVCLCLIGCGTGQAPCFKSDMSKSILRWGDYTTKERLYNGYQMTPAGSIQEYRRDSSGKETTKVIGNFDNKDACKILGLYYWAMKTVQVCSEPGENLNFLTFVNNETNTFWNIYWNDKFNTLTNKNLKVVNDSINSIMKRIEKK